MSAAPPRASALKRIGLAALIGLVTLNVWTGSPLFALWVGSRVQGTGPPTMAPIFVVAVVLAALSLALVRLLAYLGAAYDDATGEYPTVRKHTPWLRSMRGERPQYEGIRARLTVLERTVVIMVVVVVALFEIWFFFFSTSPIDQRSGRSALPGNARPYAGPLPAARSAGAASASSRSRNDLPQNDFSSSSPRVDPNFPPRFPLARRPSPA